MTAVQKPGPSPGIADEWRAGLPPAVESFWT